MEGLVEEGEAIKDIGVAPALISLHPLEKCVAVAVGSELRIFDLETDCPVALTDDSGGPSHSDAIRAISFDASGKLFVSAGDDRLVKIWKTSSWHCFHTVRTEKRVSAVAISHDGHYVVFADKFGVVWLVGLDEDGENHTQYDKKAVQILGHYCSIITSLKFSPDGRFIASADRDFKIRISVFPKAPLKGAHEIQSFCLGHTEFISCLAFLCPTKYPQGFLVSGSGDSSVRLWDFISGCLLATCEVGGQSSGTGDMDHPAVTDICASHDGSVVAVATQSVHGVTLLKCNFATRTLSVTKVVTLEDSYFPTSLGLSSASCRLWMVMGASHLPSSNASQLLTRVKVISGVGKDPSSCSLDDLVVLEDTEVPGGGKLLSQLQRSLDGPKEDAALAATATMLKLSMRDLLTKKHYSSEHRETRKKNRNDKKLK